MIEEVSVLEVKGKHVGGRIKGDKFFLNTLRSDTSPRLVSLKKEELKELIQELIEIEKKVEW